MKRGLTGTQLKLLALGLVTLRQAALYLGPVLPGGFFWRCLGQLALPLLLFLAAEEYRVTSNRRFYLLRLAGLTLGMGLLNQCLGWLTGLPAPRDNLFALLFYAALLFLAYDLFTDESKQNRYIVLPFILIVFFDTVIVLGQPYLWAPVSSFFTEVFPVPSCCEGGVKLLLLAVLLYATRERRLLQAVAYGLVACLLLVIFRGGDEPEVAMMVFAAGLFLLYNGQRERKGVSFLFYGAYPALTGLFYLLSTRIGG